MPIDKSDTYSLQRRAELRTSLRGLPEKDRHAIGANFESLDPELALAITEMPPALSGMLETDHARLLDRALQAKHGEAVTELQELEGGVAITEHVVSVAREEIAQDVGGLAKFMIELPKQLSFPFIRVALPGRHCRSSFRAILAI